MAQTSTDVIVVGGGLAGLAVAALVARGGRRVTLLERSKTLGGRAITRRDQGFSFNLGGHALYRGGPARAVLDDLQVKYTGRPPAVAGSAIYEGRCHRLPAAPFPLLTTTLLSTREKLAFGKLFVSLSKIKTQPLDRVPLAEWIERQSTSPRVRQMLAAFTRLASYEHQPTLSSAGAIVSQLQGVNAGVLYLDHGWQTLVDGLRAAAERHCATIVAGAPVSRIDVDQRVDGVTLADGSAWHAPHVVLAMDAQSAAALLPAATQEETPATARRAAHVACLDLGLRKLPRPGVHFALGVDRPWYFSVHSAAATLAPAGGAVIHVMKYLGADLDRPTQDVLAELEGLVDLMQPGWREHEVARQFLPKMAATSGMSQAALGGRAGRPAVASQACPGLYLAGDWVGDEGLIVDAALASARRAATQFLTANLRPPRSKEQPTLAAKA